MTRQRHAEAGFTLIETLVAMAILAVAGTTLLTATERHAARTGAIADRIAARWVGANALNAQSLGFEMDPKWRTMLGQSWQVTTTRRSVAGSGLEEIVVRVAPDGAAGESSIVQLIGFSPPRTGVIP